MSEASYKMVWAAGTLVGPFAAAGNSEPAELGEAIQRARAGDAAAFQELMQHTDRAVYRIGLRMCGSHADAQEIVQETYLRVFRHLRRYDSRNLFRPWLYRIAMNVCRDLLRGRRDREWASETAAMTLVTLEPDAERRAAAIQESRLMAVALRRLPQKERAAVILRDVEGLSTAEVAEALKSSAATVRSQIASARRKLTEARESWRRSKP